MNPAAALRQAAEPEAVTLPDGLVVSHAGSWTIRSQNDGLRTRTWVSAACTRCGAAPCDEPLGMYASFATIDQARQELPSDWGWTVTAPPGRPEQILCPGCAAPLTRERTS